MMEQKIEKLKSEEKREAPRPKQEMKVPHTDPQKKTIEQPGPTPQEGPKPDKPKSLGNAFGEK